MINVSESRMKLEQSGKNLESSPSFSMTLLKLPLITKPTLSEGLKRILLIMCSAMMERLTSGLKNQVSGMMFDKNIFESS